MLRHLLPFCRCSLFLASCLAIAPNVEAQLFEDDFARPDGPVSGWTAAGGNWSISSEALMVGPTSAEVQIFAGDPTVELPENYTASVDWTYLSNGSNAVVGKHASVLFNYRAVGARNAGGSGGYQAFWIDRASDFGLNLVRWDGAALIGLHTTGTGGLFATPPANLRVEVNGDRIRVYGDGQLAIDVRDSTYRGGKFGVWAWAGDQQVSFDNVTIEGIILKDDFSRTTVRNWIDAGGAWSIDAGAQTLNVGPTSAEVQIFAGDPLVQLPDDYTVEFDWSFLANGNNAAVGKHASALFNYRRAGPRGASGGYQLFWIDRVSDFGLNLYRWDGGTLVGIHPSGTGGLFPTPPATIRIEVEGDRIRVYGDDVLAIDAADTTYRGGLFGLWAWSGAEHLAFDNVTIQDGTSNTIFTDEFGPQNPSLRNWTVNRGTWAIVDAGGGNMAMQGGPPPGTEQELFANPLLPGDFRADIDLKWLAPNPPGAIGRHGGVMFHFDRVAPRNAGSGYHVWWIDRASDRGWNLYRQDNGAFVPLVTGTAPAGSNPPATLTIDVSGPTIRILSDGVQVIQHNDNTYRGGRLALWTWNGEGQVMQFDNVSIIGTPVAVKACFEITGRPLQGTSLTFNASCTFGAATSYDWDFGDGVTASGQVVNHDYAAGGDYTVTLTASGPGGSDTTTKSIKIATVLAYDCAGTMASDDFQDGDIADWTANAGTWQVTAGELIGGPAGGGGAAFEQQIFLGNPSINLPNNVIIEFDWEFLSAGNVAAVGRHAGCYLGWTGEGNRWAANTFGYQLWWIDRGSDRGLNIALWNPGLASVPVAGTFGLFPEPPRNIRIEVQGDHIRVFGDDVLAFDIVNTTFRGGKFAFWTWEQGQHVKFDNLCIDADPQACFQVTSAPNYPGKATTFDAGCSFIPPAAGDPTYGWDFGDGASASGALASHVYATSGSFNVTLTVTAGGVTRTVTQPVAISPTAIAYSDNFARPDGAVSGWTVNTGPTWRLAGEALVGGPSGGQEYWIWAGDPPLLTAPNVTFEFDHTFLTAGSNAVVGRHGGFQWHCNQATNRSVFRGYTIDWIDRTDDRGLRFIRWDGGGAATILVNGQMGAATPNPPTHYKLVHQGSRIQVFVDGADTPLIDYVDGTYKGGFFGFWTWAGDQNVSIDNVTVDADPLTPCFTSTPRIAFAGEAVSFDASCSNVFGGVGTIASYQWDFGDGMSGNGAQVQHTYAAADNYTAVLTVTDNLGGRGSIEGTVHVAQNLVPFADCFDRPQGPLDGYTVTVGEWSISRGGRMQTSTTTGAPDAEAWAWIGDPARYSRGDIEFEFEVPSALFTGNPADGVRRHFGIMFYSRETITVRTVPESAGYELWWIDRTDDHGINLTRIDGTARSVLASVGRQIADPPTRWRVKVVGESIQVFIDGDETPIIDVVDGTHREGHLGFFAWKNMSVQFDNIRIPPTQFIEPPACDISITCTTMPGEPPILHVEGTALSPGECLAPPVCDCSLVEIFLDGVSLGVTAAPANLTDDIDIPPILAPGSQHVFSVRCVGPGGDSGPRADCNFTVPSEEGGRQLGGDCNQDGVVNIADASCIFNVLFTGLAPGVFPCGDGSSTDEANRALLNVNGETGAVNISQGTYLLNYLFLGGPRPVNWANDDGGCIRILDCPDRCTE
jgi:PKD repeat protein